MKSSTMIRRIILITIAVMFSYTVSSAQEMTLHFSGSGKGYPVGNIGKMTFSEDDLQLIDRNGNLIASMDTDNIGRIVFLVENEDSGISNPFMQNYLFQETEEGFSITNLGKEDFARLYSLDGYLLNTFRSIGGQIDISTHELSAGIYFLQLKHRVFKFIKK